MPYYKIVTKGKGFRAFSERRWMIAVMFGTSIPVLQPLEDDPADFRQKLNPIEPDYRAVTDAFPLRCASQSFLPILFYRFIRFAFRYMEHLCNLLYCICQRYS